MTAESRPVTEAPDGDPGARLDRLLAGVLADAVAAGAGGRAGDGSLEGTRGGSTRVAAIGERAARLLDAAARASEPASGSPDGPSTFRGPRFDALADCADAAPDERAADAALLTLDALLGRSRVDVDGRIGGGAGGDRNDDGVPADVLDRALGTACRLYPSRLLLFVLADEAPTPEALFAFGFRRLLVHPDGVLHEYRLRDYKMPPDWLNARFWANPERFELDPDEADGDGDEDEDGEDDDEED